ncbi:sensor histidine kinase [Sphingobacterium corticibacter]|uniref:Histidine kinase n=1 Tax=Sphingobacterium corticibacter TaxID=2171749 RepID=A0A2T8HGE2_9SPHI|nr:histidine kinase [Sphingobacterium corticibacter]PVH24506.1 histidine kinase [Sphingobacterium corticibacter]
MSNKPRIQDIKVSHFIVDNRYRLARHLFLLTGVLMLLAFSSLIRDIPSPHKYYHLATVYAGMMMMSYANIYILVPRLFFRGHYIGYFILLFLLVFVFLLAISWVLRQVPSDIAFEKSVDSSHTGFYDALMSLIPIILVTTMIKLFQRWTLDNTEINELKDTSVAIEMDILRNQISPHFLFNMLNGIKVTMRTDTEKAESMIFKLSDFLRYQLYENTADKTFFKSEIDFLTNLIELEKTRRENFSTSITTDIPQKEINSLLIPPNLFTIFVENAIKHSVSIGLEDSYVNVHFEKANNRLCFTCTNSKDTVYSNRMNKKPGGIGLANIRRRLELLYGDHCQLQIIGDEFIHTVKLNIPL